MEKKLGKVLGIAGLIILVKGQLPATLNSKPEVVVIRPQSEANVVEEAFDFSGIPQLRFSNVSSSSVVAGIGFNIVPSVVDIEV